MVYYCILKIYALIPNVVGEYRTLIYKIDTLMLEFLDEYNLY